MRIFRSILGHLVLLLSVVLFGPKPIASEFNDQYPFFTWALLLLPPIVAFGAWLASKRHWMLIMILTIALTLGVRYVTHELMSY